MAWPDLELGKASTNFRTRNANCFVRAFNSSLFMSDLSILVFLTFLTLTCENRLRDSDNDSSWPHEIGNRQSAIANHLIRI